MTVDGAGSSWTNSGYLNIGFSGTGTLRFSSGTHTLNAGGFGMTYLARDSLDRIVVIKECFPSSMCCRNDGNVTQAAAEVEVLDGDALFLESLDQAHHPVERISALFR